ncbi:MAG TPA: calcium-binding protein [Solirubrobacterales bacterium]|nr:calcium-binding protein [Solirubrobacterales bacterium]
MLGNGPQGGWMRRFVVLACSLGLLLALPVSAATAKEVAVPLSNKVLDGYKYDEERNACAVITYLEWPAQEGAQAWRLEYFMGGSLKKVNSLKPPFSDAPHPVYGWAPPAGAHWYFTGWLTVATGLPAPDGDPLNCGEYVPGWLEFHKNAFGGGTIYITVPDTPEDEEKEKEEEEKKREEEEKTTSKPKDDPEVPPGKKGKATCRGKTPTIFVKPGPPTNGTARRDVIMGTPKRDVIRARGGNDLVCGLGGNDIILGGGGKDVLLGHGGGDTLHGQAGRDTVLGGGGADQIFGQAAADRLFGQAGADALNGGADRPDLCNGGRGRDRRRSPGCELRRQIP